MRLFLRRFIQRFVHDFVPRIFVVLLSPVREEEKVVIAHFSKFAKVISTNAGSGSVTLKIKSTRKALKLAINMLGNEINAGYEEIKRSSHNDATYILAHEAD